MRDMALTHQVPSYIPLSTPCYGRAYVQMMEYSLETKQYSREGNAMCPWKPSQEPELFEHEASFKEGDNQMARFFGYPYCISNRYVRMVHSLSLTAIPGKLIELCS